MGKTTVVEAFLARVRAADAGWIAQGQSIASYGAGEAYLPWLEAWSRLGRTRDGADLVGQLRRHAPSWLAELPSLGAADGADAKPSPSGATRERMLREMAELVEVITIEHPLVLASKICTGAILRRSSSWPTRPAPRARAPPLDRHLSHRGGAPSRRTPARHLQDLLGRRLAHEIRLEPLAVADVDAYVRGDSPATRSTTRSARSSTIAPKATRCSW
jgi:hypothetical protein